MPSAHLSFWLLAPILSFFIMCFQAAGSCKEKDAEVCFAHFQAPHWRIEPWAEFLNRCARTIERSDVAFGLDLWSLLARVQTWSFAGELVRRTDGRWSQIVSNWTPSIGQRNVGRPLTRWSDEIIAYAGDDWQWLAMCAEDWQAHCSGFIMNERLLFDKWSMGCTVCPLAFFGRESFHLKGILLLHGVFPNLSQNLPRVFFKSDFCHFVVKVLVLASVLSSTMLSFCILCGFV